MLSGDCITLQREVWEVANGASWDDKSICVGVCLYFDIIGVKSSATAPHLYFQLSVH